MKSQKTGKFDLKVVELRNFKLCSGEMLFGHFQKSDPVETIFSNRKACRTCKTATMTIKLFEDINMHMKSNSKTVESVWTKLLHDTMILPKGIPSLCLQNSLYSFKLIVTSTSSLSSANSFYTSCSAYLIVSLFIGCRFLCTVSFIIFLTF